MDRTARPRTLLVDPAGRRHAPRERAATRWFTRTVPDGRGDLAARGCTESTTAAAVLPIAA